jgi:predicted phosphodiesterase
MTPVDTGGGVTGSRRALVWTVGWAAIGALVALGVAAQVTRGVGPFDVTFSARASWHGDTLMRLAPLGTVRLDTHDSPLRIDVRLDELRSDEAAAIAREPERLEQLGDGLASDVRSALIALGLRGLLLATIGGAIAAVAVSRRMRLALAGGSVGVLIVASTATATAATWRPEALSEPTYSGLLSAAPQAVGDVEAVLDRFNEYRAQLAQLAGNVAAVYQAGQTLPVLGSAAEATRILHVSDIHLNPQAFDIIEELVQQFDIDAVVDTGDLTSFGSPVESQFVAGIGRLKVPYVWVRGNHDSMETQEAVAAQPNAVVLDGSRREVAGLAMFGVGDPRFTPDKSGQTGKDVEREEAEAYRSRVASMLRREPRRVDVLLVHDQRIAGSVGDEVPLVLAGHTHVPRRTRIGAALLLVQGTTGGAGFANLQDERPRDLSFGVLHFRADSHRLVAYDQITMSGLGERAIRVERHAVSPVSRARTTTPTTTTTTSSSTTTTTTAPS